MIEFALVLMPLLLLVFGITEFGRALYQYNTLAKATRDAARYLTIKTPGDPVAKDEAKCLAVTGSTSGAPACSDPPLVAGLTTAMVSICDQSSCPSTHFAVLTGSGTINLVTVTITGFPFKSAVPEIIPMDIVFDDISTTMRTI